MIFDPFVLPFLIGLVILIGILLEKYSRWLRDLSTEEWRQVLRGFFSYRLFKALRDVFLESLLHRKIFKQNILLGWMHMSFALGWLLLIFAGAAESKYYTHGAFKPPYFPIFFNYFIHDNAYVNNAKFFVFIMDFLLLIILSGLVLALIKRINRWIFGMKKTTRFNFGNRLTIASLWLIFPLRLLAESFSSALHNNGGFLTGAIGRHIANLSGTFHYSLFTINYLSWWAYSISLGVFFVCIPFSRYMHIPTEVLLIFLRSFGIKSRKIWDGFSQIEVNSCPRCGLCIDVCPMNRLFDNEKITPSYYLKSIRDRKVKEEVTFDCLMCGRCKEFCPVGIDTLTQRSLQRSKFISDGASNILLNSNYQVSTINGKRADVAYFAGCMTHLTPTIKHAVTEVLRVAGKNFTFIDSEGGACCGRPQILAGNYELAEKMMEYNRKLIKDTKAKILLVSCPICYKVFKDDYKLSIEVLHHTEYFSRLIDTNKLPVIKTNKTVVYHDPCELGRGEGIYKQPRNILKKISVLKKTRAEKGKSLCCGGSLGVFEISDEKRSIIRQDTLKSLTEPNPDYIVSACPLCKKTLGNGSNSEVKDISEMILMAMNNL
jgi:Fe-S oxidoreductase